MSPKHAGKGSRRYRYDVSQADPALRNKPLMRVPAGEVEKPSWTSWQPPLPIRTCSISVNKAAARMGLKADYYRVFARISFLAPDIVAAIAEEQQPGTLTRQKRAHMTDLPLEWEAQRMMIRTPSKLQKAA